MKRHIFNAAMLLCAGAMLMTGCNKDKEQVFHLTINDNEAKTHLGEGYTTWWDEGDTVYINGSDMIIINGETGDFNPNGQVWVKPDVTLEPVNGQFYAFYAGRGTNVVPSVTEDTQSYTFTMPSSYTYDASILQSPMAGIGTYQGNDPNTQIDVPFQNLFALLELTVPIANDALSYDIEITEFGGAETNPVPLSGNFIATCNNGIWSAAYANDNSGSNYLTITKNTGETKVFIPIPAGNHTLNIYVNPGAYNQMKVTYGFQAGKYYKVALVDTTIIPIPIPIDDTTVVYAGTGNIRYFHANSGSLPVGWSLEENQWDTTNYWAENKQALKSSQISWMPNADCRPENLDNGGSVHGTYYVYGYPSLLGITDTHYRVLTMDEWTAVLGLNATTKNYAYVSITYTKRVIDATNTYGREVNLTQNGMILLPPGTDAYFAGTGITRGQTYNSWDDAPVITSEEFEELESHGCSFLPAFGYVYHHGNSGVYADNGEGYYRTSTPGSPDGSGSFAYVLHFTPSTAPVFSTDIHYGAGVAVRLFYVAHGTNPYAGPAPTSK